MSNREQVARWIAADGREREITRVYCQHAGESAAEKHYYFSRSQGRDGSAPIETVELTEAEAMGLRRKVFSGMMKGVVRKEPQEESTL